MSIFYEVKFELYVQGFPETSKFRLITSLNGERQNDQVEAIFFTWSLVFYVIFPNSFSVNYKCSLLVSNILDGMI